MPINNPVFLANPIRKQPIHCGPVRQKIGKTGLIEGVLPTFAGWTFQK